MTTDEKSSKKKKSHKNDDSKKKKTKRDKSHERDRSKDRHHHHHETDKNSSKKSSPSSSSKNHRREQHNEEILINDDHHKSSRHHSSSTTSLSNNKRRSPSHDVDHSNRKSSRSTTSKKDETPSSKKSTLSPVVDHHHHHSNHHRRGSSRTLSPSPSSSRLQTKHSSSPKKDDCSSATTTKSNRQQKEPVLHNSKSTNSNSPTDSYTNQPQKTRTNDSTLTTSTKPQKSHESSSPHHHSSSSNKHDKSKTTTTNHDESSTNRRKSSSSRHDRRSHSRHRSRSKEDKINRKAIESTNSEESSLNKNKTNHGKDSTTVHENSQHDKKSNRGSSIPSTTNEHRRKSSSDHHRYDRHDSPSNYNRRNHDDDYYYNHHHHRHSHYPNTHYVHHHRHHYRSISSRYHYHRRSPSPRSHQYRSRYFSSTSSSFSPSPRRRSRTSSSSSSRSSSSSSSSRSSSSYSSISRTSSSRSSSRNNHYYHHHQHHHHERKFRRSPTLEKLFLKASESIESVSTQKNPNQPLSSTTAHLIPVQTSNTTSDIQLTSPMNSLSETNAFYSESFSGFSVPPPPYISQPQQRCLKEITTDSSTSNRLMFNERSSSSTSSAIDEVISIKPIQSNDNLSTNVRSGSNKPPRVSRFSDITPTVPTEPVLNTNLSVDTPLDYIQINENINCLSTTRRQQKRHNREVMECECTTSEYDRSRGIKACGHECLNRMLLIECSSNCPCGQWCTNRRFQRHSFANHKLALFKTEMKGYGLRTISSIRKSRFLVEYIGEVIDMDELTRRNKKYKRDGNIHQYVMSLIHGTVIDSTIKGNWARFINHSCEPNCVAEKWLVNGEYRMGIFSKRDLIPNEEITIDYRFETFGSVDLANEKCYCGAQNCRGTISIKSNKNNNLNKRQNRRQLIDDELLDYLHDDETNEYIIPKTIDEIRQLIQIMSRTDSENVRIIELDLIRKSSQKHFELPRLFLECNGLHVLCSWMKDILIDNNDDEQQQYSEEFKYHLLDFIHIVLPIKDRTTVIKNGLLELVYKKLKLPLSKIDNIENNNDQEQINDLMNSILNHLNSPIISKLFHIYSTWMSLKERYIIPKRKEPQETSNNHYHHHRHHHHHSSKHSYDENNSRLNFSTRSSIIQPKPIERYNGRRSFNVKDFPRTQEQQLSKDERRKLFEQQYEDEEKARAAAAAAAANGESPVEQNEPPHKKQRTSDSTDPMGLNTPSQSQTSSMSYAHQMDQTSMIHQHLSQIPIDYIRSYMMSIGQSIPESSSSTVKEEPPLPPPPRPDDETELSRIIRLPSGWSVTMCPSDSSVYFYNQKTMTSSWIPPALGTPTENLGAALDLSPLSSAQIIEQRRPYHHHHQQPQQPSSSSRSTLKVSKHPHRHSRSHRYNHHQSTSSNNKRKRLTETEFINMIKENPHSQSIEETSMITTNEQIKEEEESNDKIPDEHMEQMSVATVSKPFMDEDNETTVKESSSELNDNIEEQTISTKNNSTTSSSSSSSFRLNRDLLRKNISQHVHTTLKPYTKRTCKQGRIVSTDDIKYLVKKFTLAVLDKEIEKARNEGIPLAPVLTERVRLKTEVYVKKYMNKMGSVFQRHEINVNASSQQPPSSQTTITSNSE